MVFTLGYLIAQSENISGLIYNSKSKLPLFEANITLVKSDIGTVTNEKGEFSLKLETSKDSKIIISMIGYKDTTISIIKHQTRLDKRIYLNPSVIQLKEVHVDSHQEIYENNNPSSISMFGNKFQRNIKGDLASTLIGESGLAIRSSGQATQRPILRGYSGDRFLITRDGTELGDLSNSTADHAIAMEVSTAEGIEILRGPETLIYGSNTIAGVINISSSLKNQQKLDVSKCKMLFGHESSNQSSLGNINIIIPFNNYQFSTSITKRVSKNQTSPKGSLKNTALTKNEYAYSVTQFGKKNITTLSFRDYSSNYGIPGSPEGHIEGVDLRMGNQTQKLTYHSDISFISFKIFDLEQGYVKYGHQEFVKNSSFASVDLSQNIFYLNTLLSRKKLKIGSNFQHREFLVDGFYWTPNTVEKKLAVFGIRNSIIKGVEIQMSGRIEYRTINPRTNDTFFSNLNETEVKPRDFLLFSYGISSLKKWGFSSFYNQILYTSRAPKIEDLFSDGPHLGSYSYEIGDPALNQENTIGYENTIAFYSHNYNYSLTSYINYSSNFHISQKMGEGYEPGADWIEWGSGPSGWLYKYQLNGLQTEIYGFEPQFKIELKYFDFHGNASFIRGLNKENNNSLSYIPPDKIRFQIEKNISLFKNTLEFIFVQSQNRVGQFETPTDEYQLLNYSASYTIGKNGKTHKLILQINNILNQTYYNHLSKIKIIMPEPGLSANASYRVNF